MEITHSLIANRPEIIDDLITRSKNEVLDTLGVEFEQFIAAYMETFCLEEWLGRDIADLYVACRGFFLFFKDRKEDENKVRVFNPNSEEDGWQCGRTVLLVACKDSSFLVDSIRITLQQRQLPIFVVKSSVFKVERNKGKLCSVALSRLQSNRSDTQRDALERISAADSKDTLVYFEVSTLNNPEALNRLKSEIFNTLSDVQSVVNSYQSIVSHLDTAQKEIATLKRINVVDNSEEELAFLKWMSKSHYTFLGYRDFNLISNGKNLDESVLSEDIDARLGLFTKLEDKNNKLSFEKLPKGVKDFYRQENNLSFSKSSTRSNVHRSVYPDYVVVKKFNDHGVCVGERRFLGIYTYNVSVMSPLEIPILRRKASSVLDRACLDEGSHDGRNLLRIIKEHPKGEMFEADKNDLIESISQIAAINERHITRLILRKDDYDKFVNCLVFVPRDLFNTEVRKKIEKLIATKINAIDYDTTTFFSESSLTRSQMVFRVDSHENIDVDVTDLEKQIDNLCQNWASHFQEALFLDFGESVGGKYFQDYRHSFPKNYQNDFDARLTIADLKMLQKLSGEADIAMHFYQPITYEVDKIKFKILHLKDLIELSLAVPILENLGLRVLGEQPYKLRTPGGEHVWMHDFILKFALPIQLDIHAVKTLFESAFKAVWKRNSENDNFNKLILAARLPWREVSLLRAYANYLKQTSFSGSVDFIANTLVTYPEITRNLVALFKAYFDPRLNKRSSDKGEFNDGYDSEESSQGRESRLEQKILDSLDGVSNLNQDAVIRRYLALIKGTVRTNFFQKDQDNCEKSYISLKFSPREISGIPEPRPLFEIFVFSPRIEGVHLRGGKVARGGLRWSDRYEDYRTEVLGLVKAQAVKNAVIVPDGAKGGFVAKQLTGDMTREEYIAEGIACYQIFIRGLLDVTDNLIAGEIIPPKNVKRRDDPDPYLVVAADKGTATFSDIANTISEEYGHWLGDAFASGGSQGYDHKGMGITARGAWVSVQRHFRELGTDIQSEDFSVIGIGDMAGDVFGNGMLLSEHICLRAAFNHLFIFIDPMPNSKESYEERRRLFDNPKLNWGDYNKSLISAGGGVFNRSAKSIPVSEQMKKVFGFKEDKLSPNDLIKGLLLAPVDLLWNGGIGTYVKSSHESHADVGDKANDVLRVDGRDLQCKVIGEGGNLGFTQLARIEFSLHGGSCNTDFIDNAAGVDCSDHEVNIKILIDDVVSNGDLTTKQRNLLLEKMTNDVSDLVLKNNYRQTFALSVAEHQVANRINEYRRFMLHLESQGKLDRELEFLPSDEALVERIGKGKYLSRPELCVLISYAKVQLKEILFESELFKDAYISKFAATAFPDRINNDYTSQVSNHRLHKEIVGTQVANDLINNLGITSVYRLSETIGASIEDIARAYIISRDIFEMESFLEYIESLDNRVPSKLQLELMHNMIRRVRRGTRWLLRNRRGGLDAKKEVEAFSKTLSDIQLSAKNISGDTRNLWIKNSNDLKDRGIKEYWAVRLSMPDNLFSGLAIVETFVVSKIKIEDCTTVFFYLLDHLNLNWFASQLSAIKVESYWQAVARESHIDDLEAQIRRLTLVIVNALSEEQPLDLVLEQWFEKNEFLIKRWKSMIDEVKSAQTTDYAMFSVALRELIDLTQASEYA